MTSLLLCCVSDLNDVIMLSISRVNDGFILSISRHRFAPAHGQARARELVQKKYERIAADFEASAADIASTLTQIVSALLVRRSGGIWRKPQRCLSINRCHGSLQSCIYAAVYVWHGSWHKTLDTIASLQCSTKAVLALMCMLSRLLPVPCHRTCHALLGDDAGY